MLNEKGQAFDAFKLLIAAVVAVVILGIILSMLQSFFLPGGDPTSVMAQQVQNLKNAIGSGKLSTQLVQFKKGDAIATKGVWTTAGVNPRTVHFCGINNGYCDNASCGGSKTDGGYYNFTTEYFTLEPDAGDFGERVRALSDIQGYVWVFNTGDGYCIGLEIPQQ